MNEKYFYDLDDHNYYTAEIIGNELRIYLLNTDTYKKNFIVSLEPIELARRMMENEVRNLDEQEEAKLRLLFGDENETGRNL